MRERKKKSFSTGKKDSLSRGNYSTIVSLVLVRLNNGKRSSSNHATVFQILSHAPLTAREVSIADTKDFAITMLEDELVK